MTIGQKTWAIADGHIPPYSHGPQPQMASHETFSVLNTNEEVAHLEVTIYYSDRDPVGPYRVAVDGRRTRHFRFNDLSDPETIPLGTDFAAVIEADVPVVVQHTRLDSRQAENALLSTMPFAGG